MDVDGALTFARVEGGTRMRWSWDMRLRGARRAWTPLLRAIGPWWEHRNWAGLKQLLERQPHDGAGTGVQ